MPKTLYIKHSKISGIMNSLTEQLGIDYSNDGDDYCIDLTKKLGRGYLRGIQFSHGLSVIEVNLTLKDKTTFKFEKQDVNFLHFLFNTDTAIHHIVSETKKNDTISKLQYCMFSNDTSNTNDIVISKNKPTDFFIILIDRKAFEEKLLSITNDLSNELEQIFKDVNGVNFIYNKNYFSLEIAQYIEEFRHCELESFMKPMFLEGKTYEILTYQLQHFNDDNGEKKVLLRKSTIDKIENAIDIIKDELDVRISVHTLAKRVGLNQNTLQNGFKNLFQTSVNEYIKNYRIERAKTLIENSDLNITEITYKIGINSRSYFSKLFKERFGISPSEYINQVRKKTKSA
ncbi:AraC family transcriptional regulator [uncultured Psychroserpens sp.]|uniref:helix-turn-helix domain-containing protein n=1 Tax=uncultured Psychroserpens sp. TaxID=255436 RepID=UPI002601AC64|nr:AraC family transcriptional regulator [uncultured Psychroserpens sp.]